MIESEKEHKYEMTPLSTYGKVAIIGLGSCLLLAVLGKSLDKYESKNSKIKRLNERIEILNEYFYDLARQRDNYLPNNITMKDINHDGLQDLVYSSNKLVYFQTKNGKFQTLTEILDSEKEKANARADSIRNVILKTTVTEVKRKYSAK